MQGFCLQAADGAIRCCGECKYGRSERCLTRSLPAPRRLVDGEILEDEQVLAERIDDITEPLAIESAYQLAVAAEAKRVIVTALKQSGSKWVPDPDTNPRERRTVWMLRPGNKPLTLTIDGPPGGHVPGV
jgi:hypothetical protein